MALTIDQSSDGGSHMIRLTGELDTGTAGKLAPVIDDLKNNPPAVLVLHLKDLDYISSAGLRCVFQMKRLMKNHGGEFIVSQPSPQVRKVFEIVKAVPLQSVFTSEEELDVYLTKIQREIGSSDPAD